MRSDSSAVEVDYLERRLLPSSSSSGNTGADDETVLYEASFREMEENYVKYQTAQWVMYSLLLALAWGIGLLMLLYLPVRRYVARADFRSRKLYVTPNSIVYKVSRPVPFPCFGVLKKEKYILLPSVADVSVEQGYLQSYFGLFSIRIENVGIRRPASDDVHILGITNPTAFRKVVLTRLNGMKVKSFNWQGSINEATLGLGGSGYPSGTLASPSTFMRVPSCELILQKLDEVKSYIKRIQNLMEKRQCTSSESLDRSVNLKDKDMAAVHC